MFSPRRQAKPSLLIHQHSPPQIPHPAVFGLLSVKTLPDKRLHPYSLQNKVRKDGQREREMKERSRRRSVALTVWTMAWRACWKNTLHWSPPPTLAFRFNAVRLQLWPLSKQKRETSGWLPGPKSCHSTSQNWTIGHGFLAKRKGIHHFGFCGAAPSFWARLTARLSSKTKWGYIFLLFGQISGLKCRLSHREQLLLKTHAKTSAPMCAISSAVMPAARRLPVLNTEHYWLCTLCFRVDKLMIVELRLEAMQCKTKR